MLKQIVPMALYMIAIMYAICFGGEFFFPEPDPAYRFGRWADSDYVTPGRLYDWDGSALFVEYVKIKGSSRHLSNVFNIFVVMAIFNILNARIINDDFNIFKGLFNNMTFCIVFVFISVAQGIIVQFGGAAMKISDGGLHGYHWLIACILGFTTWIASFLFKLLPDSICPQFGKKNENESEEGHGGSDKGGSVRRQGSSLRGKLRGSFRAHSKQGSLRHQGSDRPNSHRKQQSQQNMAPVEKDYK